MKVLVKGGLSGKDGEMSCQVRRMCEKYVNKLFKFSRSADLGKQRSCKRVSENHVSSILLLWSPALASINYKQNTSNTSTWAELSHPNSIFSLFIYIFSISYCNPFLDFSNDSHLASS